MYLKDMMGKVKIVIVSMALLFFSIIIIGDNKAYAHDGDVCCVNDTDEADTDEISTMLSNVMGADDFEIGTEIDCFNINNNSIITYIPIFKNEKCVLMGVKEDEALFSLSNDVDFYQQLIKQSETGSDYLVYVNGGAIYTTDEKETIELENNSEYINTRKKNKFEEFSYNEKLEYVKKKFHCKLEKKKILRNYGKVKNNQKETFKDNRKLYSYLGIFDSNSSSEMNSQSTSKLKESKVCGIKKFVKQEQNNCWAASVATIVNYKKNKNLSAGDVNMAMNTSWYVGQDVTVVKKALAKYGLTYKIKASQLSWQKVRSDIGNNRPFCMGFAAEGATPHMVTGYGYSIDNNDNKYIAIWDSNGYYRLLTYKSKKSTLTMYGYKYKWNETVY